jgi:membrane protein
MLVWAVAYYVLPDVEQQFKFITPGSVIGVTIWIVASVGFSYYVRNFAKYDATYGSLGGMIVLLLWMWLSSQTLLLGAEMNAIIERWSPEGKAAGEKTFDGSVYEPEQGQGQRQSAPPTQLDGRPPGKGKARRALERVALTASGALLGAAIMAIRRRTA